MSATQSEKKSSGGGCVVAFLVLLAVVLVIVFVGATSGSMSRGGAPARISGPSPLDAQIVCPKFVKERLKSPTSAEFPVLSSEFNVKSNGGGQYVVTSYVDADNSFGAHVRVPYVCTVQHNSQTGLYNLVDLQLLE